MADKIEPEKCPQAIDTVQGCGVPGCPICMSISDRGRSSLFSYDSIRAAFESSREINRKLTDTLIYGTLEPPPQIDSKLERAERQARESIEKYLFESKSLLEWSDVVGNEEAHRAMIEAIEFPIKHKELFEFYNKKMTKGILLSGPPGCGKTMMAKAAANVISKLHGKSVSFISIAATELQKPYVGQTEALIRAIFDYARAYKALHGHQLVVFIDEADAILPRRSGGQRYVAGWEESNVATFLAEMDGMEESGALIILATNRPEAIDQALLREGRIDRKVVVQRPDATSAGIILERALRNAPIAINPVGVQAHNEPVLEATHTVKREYLTALAINELFSPLRHILKVKTERGTDFLNLADCVSGAMVVGLVERAKANAFHRDIAAGTRSGIIDQDMMVAIEAVMREQIANPDFYALTELAQRLKSPVLELDRVQQPELKYSGTLQ